MTSTAVSETAQKLKAALELLGPNGENWGRGAFRRGEKYCIAGACMQVAYTEPAYRKLFRELEIASDCPILSVWNDKPERTFAEVKAVFEKAIEANL